MNLFPNRTGGECAISSVANLLLFQYNDRRTAQVFYEQAHHHPLVLPGGGAYLTTLGYLVHDVTQGHYLGRVFLHEELGKEHLQDPRQAYSEKAFGFYGRALEKSLHEKWLNPGEAYAGPPPALVAVSHPGMNIDHAVLYLPGGSAISGNHASPFPHAAVQIQETMVLERNEKIQLNGGKI